MLYDAASPAALEAAVAVTDAIRAELVRSERWDVYMDREEVGRRRRVRLSVSPDIEAAIRAGRALEVEKVVCGAVTAATANVTKTETKRGVSYSLTASATIRHVLADVRSGKVEVDVVLSGTSRDTSSTPFSTSRIAEAIQRSTAETARLFVRRLVPDVEGVVLAKITVDSRPLLLISLGKAQGLGPEMDLEFLRQETVLDDAGKPVIGPAGEPVTVRRKVAALMRSDHKRPTPCVGQPRTIHEDTAEVEVGYYHSEFLGRRFEMRREAIDAVRVGDTVRPIARPDDIR